MVNSNNPQNQTHRRRHYRRRRPFPHQGLSTPIFSPQPLETLLAERAYLAATLRTHEAAAASLAQCHAALQLQLASNSNPAAGATTAPLARKLRAVQQRLAGAAAQERAVLVRLSEIHVEINTRQRLGLWTEPFVVGEVWAAMPPMWGHVQPMMEMGGWTGFEEGLDGLHDVQPAMDLQGLCAQDVEEEEMCCQQACCQEADEMAGEEMDPEEMYPQDIRGKRMSMPTLATAWPDY